MSKEVTVRITRRNSKIDFYSGIEGQLTVKSWGKTEEEASENLRRFLDDLMRELND